MKPLQRTTDMGIVLIGLLAFLIATSATATPLLWVADSSRQLATVDVQTGAVTLIGQTDVAMSDIAFDPSGILYGDGIDGNLYRIDRANASTTRIGALGAFVNSLVFDASGTLYAASNVLYTIDTLTGLATPIGNHGTHYDSAGDLAFVDGRLYLSSSNSSSSEDDLYILDTTNGAGTLIGGIGFPEVLGLASANHRDLFGLSGSRLLSLDPTTGAATERFDLSGQGLARAYGSAFATEAAPVATSGGAWLLLPGMLLLTIQRSRRMVRRRGGLPRR